MKPLEETETTIHLETKIGHVFRLNFLEILDQLAWDVIRKLPGSLLPPFRAGLAWRKAAKTVFAVCSRIGNSTALLVTAAQIAKNRDRLARVVVAVVIEENDFAPDFALQAAGGLDFREKKTTRKNPAGLLSETDNWGRHVVSRRF